MAQAILWDMDGTLLDSEPLHEAALVVALRTVGLTVPDAFHALVVGRDARSVHDWCVAHLGLALPLQDWLALKYRTYFASLGTLVQRDGAVDLWRALQGEGRLQGVVSNSDRLVVNANLQAAGIAAPGMLTVSRNDVRAGKPDPEPYLRAAWLAGLEPAGCIAVEDSVTGATAGLAAGMRTLFWPQSDLPTPPGAERVRDVAHLGALLRS